MKYILLFILFSLSYQFENIQLNQDGESGIQIENMSVFDPNKEQVLIMCYQLSRSWVQKLGEKITFHVQKYFKDDDEKLKYAHKIQAVILEKCGMGLKDQPDKLEELFKLIEKQDEDLDEKYEFLIKDFNVEDYTSKEDLELSEFEQKINNTLNEYIKYQNDYTKKLEQTEKKQKLIEGSKPKIAGMEVKLSIQSQILYFVFVFGFIFGGVLLTYRKLSVEKLSKRQIKKQKQTKQQ